jgi:gliding motility-associated-like protein
VTIGGNDLDNASKPGINTSTDSIQVAVENTQKSYDVHMISIQDDSLCFADPSGFSNKVDVVVYAVPDANAGAGDEVCSNQFSLSATTPLPSHTGLWSVAGGTFADPADPSTLVTMDQENYGKKYITWTVTNWHCTKGDSVLVIFDQQPTEINAGDDQTLDFLYATQLQADMPVIGSGTWKVVEGTGIISDDTLYNATITELAVNNLIRWIIVNGVCPEIKDSVSITVNPLEIQKGFTPNGDGINDEFVIPTPNAEKITIKIYNRTGVLVFDRDDYTQGDLWDGTKNKIDLPEGTYFYWMKIWVKGKTEPVEFKSFVEILR